MASKQFITEMEAHIGMFFWEDGHVVDMRFFPKEEAENGRRLGNIYVGKISSLMPEMNGAFVEIENREICYLPLHEVPLPLRIKGKEGEPWRVGDEVLVQLAREKMKQKPAMVTGKLTLNGRYLVLVRGMKGLHISEKIRDDEWRMAMHKKVDIFENQTAGIILRTNAHQATWEQIYGEWIILEKLYQEILETAPYRTCFSKLYEAPVPYLPVLRDAVSDQETGMFPEVWTDIPEVYERCIRWLEPYEQAGRVHLYDDSSYSMDKLYGLKQEIRDALAEKVWLKSGAYLLIQMTEALVAIDVNSGKASGGKREQEAHFLRINLEAAKMIAKQIRLRNLSGIILVDFINMKAEGDREQVLSALKKYTREDPVKCQVFGYTQLQLVEMTRKKIYPSLSEQLKKEMEKKKTNQLTH